MPEPTSPNTRLEQGAALSLLWESVDDLRKTIEDLHAVIDAHAMTTFVFLRDVADGKAPDPSDLLRTRGQVEALLDQLCDCISAEDTSLAELRVGLLPNDDSDPALEAQALEQFRERYRRHGTATASPRSEHERSRGPSPEPEIDPETSLPPEDDATPMDN